MAVERAPTEGELLVAQDAAQQVAGHEALVLTKDELGYLMEEQYLLGVIAQALDAGVYARAASIRRDMLYSLARPVRARRCGYCKGQGFRYHAGARYGCGPCARSGRSGAFWSPR